MEFSLCLARLPTEHADRSVSVVARNNIATKYSRVYLRRSVHQEQLFADRFRAYLKRQWNIIVSSSLKSPKKIDETTRCVRL